MRRSRCIEREGALKLVRGSAATELLGRIGVGGTARSKEDTLMPSYLASYFQAEKHESAVFIAMGLASIAAAIWAWQRRPQYRAIAYPLVAIALIQLVVGGSVFARTDAQVAALVEQRRADPTAFRAAEVGRMAQVMTNFQLYKTIEIGILVVGVGIIVLFRKRPALAAIGVGCLLQGGAMLVFDLFAETRGRTYVEAIARE